MSDSVCGTSVASIVRMGKTWMIPCFAVGLVACGSGVDLFPQPGGQGGSGSTVASVTTAASTTGAGGTDPCDLSQDAWLAFGSMGTDVVNHMALHPDGRIFVAGRTEGNIVSGGTVLAEGFGDGDAFVATLNEDLVPIEVRVLGDAADQGILDLAVTPDGGLVLVGYAAGTIDLGGIALTATADTDLLVAKLDRDGQTVWASLFPGSGFDYATSVAVDAAGNIVVGGVLAEDITVGENTLVSAGEKDGLLIRLDPQGLPLWAASYGDEGEDLIEDVAVFSDGSIAITGTHNGLIDFGGGAMGKPATPHERDAFLVRIDPSGGYRWGHVFEGPNMVRGRTVVVDGEDDVIAAGQFTSSVGLAGELRQSQGGSDLYLIKLDPDGERQWVRQWGGSGIENLRALSVTSTNDLLFAMPASVGVDWGCGVLGGAPGSPEAAFMGLAPDGSTRFTHMVGDQPMPHPADHQYGYEALELPDGRVVALGGFHGAVELDGTAVASQGSLDAFVVVVDPTP